VSPRSHPMHPYDQPSYENYITIFRKEVNCLIDMMHILDAAIIARGLKPVTTDKLFDIVTDQKYTTEKRYKQEYGIAEDHDKYPISLLPDDKEELKAHMKQVIIEALLELKND